MKESFVPAKLVMDWAPERTATAAETVTDAADDSADAVGARAAMTLFSSFAPPVLTSPR